MSNAEIFYLVIVIGGMTAFMLTLVYCSRITDKRLSK